MLPGLLDPLDLAASPKNHTENHCSPGDPYKHWTGSAGDSGRIASQRTEGHAHRQSVFGREGCSWASHPREDLLLPAHLLGRRRAPEIRFPHRERSGEGTEGSLSRQHLLDPGLQLGEATSSF